MSELAELREEVQILKQIVNNLSEMQEYQHVMLGYLLGFEDGTALEKAVEKSRGKRQ